MTEVTEDVVQAGEEAVRSPKFLTWVCLLVLFIAGWCVTNAILLLTDKHEPRRGDMAKVLGGALAPQGHESNRQATNQQEDAVRPEAPLRQEPVWVQEDRSPQTVTTDPPKATVGKAGNTALPAETARVRKTARLAQPDESVAVAPSESERSRTAYKKAMQALSLLKQ